MSLPANQQRVLVGMERALRASEPHMASMFAIFARLNEGSEPGGAEPLKRRRRGLQHGRGVYAAALIPVVFIMVIAGVLLGGSAHGLTTCGSGSAAFGGSPWITESSCRTSGRPAPGSATPGGAKGAKGANVTQAAKGARDQKGAKGSKGRRGPKGAEALSGPGLAGASCAAIALTVRAAARAGAQPFVPSASGTAGTQRLPVMCYT